MYKVFNFLKIYNLDSMNSKTYVKNNLKKYFIYFVLSSFFLLIWFSLYLSYSNKLLESFLFAKEFEPWFISNTVFDYPNNLMRAWNLYKNRLEGVYITSDKKLSDKVSNYIWNIETLQWNFEKARDSFQIKNWEYYFNTANTYLFEWYRTYLDWDLFESFELLSESIKAYNKSAKVLWDPEDEYAWDIINNRVIAYSIRLLISAQICADIFSDIIDNFEKLIDNIVDLIDKIYNQMVQMQSWQKELEDEFLVDCLDSLIESNKESYLNLVKINESVIEYKYSALDMLEDYIQQDPYSCAIESDNIKNKFLSAYNSMNTALQGFYMSYNVLDMIIKEKDEKTLRYLCENADKFSENIDDANEEMKDWMQWLDELFNPDKWYRQDPNRQHQDPNFDEDWEDLFNEQDEERPRATDKDPNYDILEDWMQEKMKKEMREQSWDRIQEMYEKRSRPKYTPKDYIHELFNDFYGKPEDFGDNW